VIVDSDRKSEPVQDFSFANEISTSTLVRLLVRKGIFTVDEIVTEEVRERSNTSSVNRTASDKSQNHKTSWLRRKASHYRWSRRLTARLFGWEWRRVKVRTVSKENENQN
jgi:hypothetical protein